jgi:hypothetical protein
LGGEAPVKRDSPMLTERNHCSHGFRLKDIHFPGRLVQAMTMYSFQPFSIPDKKPLSVIVTLKSSSSLILHDVF